MPSIKPQHWKTLVCVFRRAGFEINRQKGSHIVLTKKGCIRPVIIPQYTQVGKDIILNNLRLANVSREEYFNYLEQC